MRRAPPESCLQEQLLLAGSLNSFSHAGTFDSFPFIGDVSTCHSCRSASVAILAQLVYVCSYGQYLKELEDLSRTELVWLNTYLAGRLRALPPENEQQPHPLPKAMPPMSVTTPGTTCSEGLPAATVAPLPERIDALNYSLDPWERTGAAIQLRPQPRGPLPVLVSVASLHPGALVTLILSLMNTLYVWFPASWGPSVVEAISKRNQKWLQQHPVHRDPAMFNPLEVENGPASRKMRYKIQKWNVRSKEVHPILVANARVDWMSLDDSDIIQQFEILREGILRDVFSQRASSTWQEMQPQRLTASLLLPDMNSKADEWLDFLQGQRQFWPTMTLAMPLWPQFGCSRSNVSGG